MQSQAFKHLLQALIQLRSYAPRPLMVYQIVNQFKLLKKSLSSSLLPNQAQELDEILKSFDKGESENKEFKERNQEQIIEDLRNTLHTIMKKEAVPELKATAISSVYKHYTKEFCDRIFALQIALTRAFPGNEKSTESNEQDSSSLSNALESIYTSTLGEKFYDTILLESFGLDSKTLVFTSRGLIYFRSALNQYFHTTAREVDAFPDGVIITPRERESLIAQGVVIPLVAPLPANQAQEVAIPLVAPLPANQAQEVVIPLVAPLPANQNRTEDRMLGALIGGMIGFIAVIVFFTFIINYVGLLSFPSSISLYIPEAVYVICGVSEKMEGNSFWWAYLGAVAAHNLFTMVVSSIVAGLFACSFISLATVTLAMPVLCAIDRLYPVALLLVGAANKYFRERSLMAPFNLSVKAFGDLSLICIVPFILIGYGLEKLGKSIYRYFSTRVPVVPLAPPALPTEQLSASGRIQRWLNLPPTGLRRIQSTPALPALSTAVAEVKERKNSGSRLFPSSAATVLKPRIERSSSASDLASIPPRRGVSPAAR